MLVIGSWRFAVFDRAPSLQPLALGSVQVLGPGCAKALPGTYLTYQENPVHEKHVWRKVNAWELR